MEREEREREHQEMERREQMARQKEEQLRQLREEREIEFQQFKEQREFDERRRDLEMKAVARLRERAQDEKRWKEQNEYTFYCFQFVCLFVCFIFFILLFKKF